MQPYDRMFGLEKICSIFSYNSNNFIFLVCGYGHGKKKKPKKGIMSYVVMFGYGK
jgi:hypothetical protein